MQRRARVHQCGLAVGAGLILATWGAMFAFQGERNPGLREWDVAFPPPIRIAPEATAPALVPGLEHVVPVAARLPHPPIERLPGVLCDPNGNVGFGASIAVHGNQLAVSAITDDTAGQDAGAVYLYERDLETGEWQYQERILADADQKLAARTLGRRQALFGRRVALANDVLAVMQGSIYHGGPTGEWPDNVYVFRATGAKGPSPRWRQEARLPTPPGGNGHGLEIAFLDSRTLLVAAPYASPVGDQSPAGAVFVYQYQSAKSETPWNLVGALRPPKNARPDQRFGVSLQADVDLIAIGMVHPGGGTKRDSDRAWSVPLFRRPRADALLSEWQAVGEIPAPDHATGAFGAPLALKGNLLVVYQGKVPLEGTTQDRTPHVFVYRAREGTRSADDWRYEGELPPPPEALEASHRAVLATDGQWIAVGSGMAGMPGGRSGLVFLYHRPPGQGWTLHRTLGPFDPANSSGFGEVMALEDGLLLVSGSDRLFRPDHGSVFLRRL